MWKIPGYYFKDEDGIRRQLFADLDNNEYYYHDKNNNLQNPKIPFDVDINEFEHTIYWKNS